MRSREFGFLLVSGDGCWNFANGEILASTHKNVPRHRLVINKKAACGAKHKV